MEPLEYAVFISGAEPYCRNTGGTVGNPKQYSGQVFEPPGFAVFISGVEPDCGNTGGRKVETLNSIADR